METEGQFMVDTVAMGQFFLRVVWFSPIIIILPVVYTSLFICRHCYITYW